MNSKTILLADNDKDFLHSLRWHIEQEGYRVVEAHSPEEAVKVLRKGEVDLAILDVRMKDDKDDKDRSGFEVATVAPTIPKVILTNFPSYESVRKMLGTRTNGPSLAADYVEKNDSVEHLLLIINRIMSELRTKELKAQYSGADLVRQQAQIFFWMNVIVAVAGTGFLLISIWLVQEGIWQAGILGAAMGILLQGISILVYRRADIANQRMERMEMELREMERIEKLLQACDELSDEENRDDCIQQVIAANAHLLEHRNSGLNEATLS